MDKNVGQKRSKNWNSLWVVTSTALIVVTIVELLWGGYMQSVDYSLTAGQYATILISNAIIAIVAAIASIVAISRVDGPKKLIFVLILIAALVIIAYDLLGASLVKGISGY